MRCISASMRVQPGRCGRVWAAAFDQQQRIVVQAAASRSSGDVQHDALRRTVLVGLTAAAHVPASRAASNSDEEQRAVELVVGQGLSFPNISAALEAAPADFNVPVTIRVSEGTYTERLVFRRPNVTVQADEGAAVEVAWRTQAPYESVVECAGVQGVRLIRLTLRHASKSVANNYAVFLHDGSDTILDGCDVSSSSGSGVGIEGAAPTLRGCRVHQCARHGVAIFGPLDASEPAGGGVVDGCEVSGNVGDGLLVRSGAAPTVLNTAFARNKGWGLSLQDCGGVYVENVVSGNGKGALQLTACDDLDAADVTARNNLNGALVVT